jgi:general secretion pathway protein D
VNDLMTLAFRPVSRLVLATALVTFVAGCVSPAPVRMDRKGDMTAGNAAKPVEPAPQKVIVNGVEIDAGMPTDTRKGAPPTLRPGTGALINQRVASSPPPSFAGTGQSSFNFEGESLHAVVKAILGDLLQQNYVIAPNVQGTVTLATPRPVDASQAMSLLEMVLAWNNARLLWTDGRYNIVPADQAVPGNLSPRTGPAANARGYELRAVPLKFISPTEMEKLLKPYARDRAVVQVDNARNLIVIGGSRAELQNYLRTIEIFDVDWLAGMSVGVFPLQSAQADKVVTQLDKIFGEGGKTPISGMFRFMPLEGQNAVMVITPQPKYLREAQTWIERIDSGGDGARLYVYEVNYVKATDLADQLGNVFGTGSGQSKPAAPSLMPGLEPVEVRTTDMPAYKSEASNALESAAKSDGGTSSGGGNSNTTISVAGGADVGISAVEESNSLLVRASPSQWESIRRAIDKLDVMPLQVHIEAQVIEVKLRGALAYGVSWFFGNDINSTIKPIADAVNDWTTYGTSVPKSGAASFTFVGPSAEAIVNALDGVSQLRVLSAPSVLVRSNVEANLTSGTQIPVISTIINNGGSTNPDNSYSQVQFRQTGITLKVKPRVSANGAVFMDISQDISSPVPNSADVSGNVAVDTSKLHTEAVVQDGETVMLAGLIKTENGTSSSGIPFLSRLPVVGALFGQQTKDDNRSEFIVLITPTVVRNPIEARQLTDDYGKQFKALQPLPRKKN